MMKDYTEEFVVFYIAWGSTIIESFVVFAEDAADAELRAYWALGDLIDVQSVEVF
jgi:hypothetical protein